MTESPAPSAVHPHGVPSTDQQIALRSAASRLGREFEGVFGGETVEGFLNSSYGHVRAHADVTTFLPLLAERFTRQRLHALAEVEGRARSGRPMVLFLSAHDAGRGPQLGEAIAGRAWVTRGPSDVDQPGHSACPMLRAMLVRG